MDKVPRAQPQILSFKFLPNQAKDLFLRPIITIPIVTVIFSFESQGVYMIFLYVGSIFAIMCIYISLLIDQCPSLTKSRENLTADPEIGSLGSTGFDTLKRAHISRARTPRTSFYLRVGALGLILSRFVVFNSKLIIIRKSMF